MDDILIRSFEKLQDVIESKPIEDRYKGVDPFDGLNSRLIRNTFLGKSRIVRLVFVQAFKRAPFNLRRIFGIKPEENPQALAVFLMTYCELYRNKPEHETLAIIKHLANKICSSKEKAWSGACWSYPFAWQARAFYQPENIPLIIPTAYCANALLDAYEITKNGVYLNTAISVAEFIKNDLNRTYDGESFSFSYSPEDNSVVYNASMMASQILARIYATTKEEELKILAKKSVDYCIRAQQPNGKWTYGKASFHQWVDSFHTGYVLSCLADYMKFCDDKAYTINLEIGIRYYVNTFFKSNGFSKYYSNKDYPLDLNNSAQLIVTLSNIGELKNHKGLIRSVMRYTINHMQAKSGYFYYQKHKYHLNRINYLRWSNSWMFYALAILKSHDQ